MKNFKYNFNQIIPPILLLGLVIPGLANAQTLSQTPLEGSVDVAPNIMINLDDSLSMYNVIRDDGYDRGTTTYSDWTYDIIGNIGVFFPDNIPVDTLNRCTSGGGDCCPSSYTRGTLSGGPKVCLKLPDEIDSGPFGTFSDTYYADHYLNYLFDTYGVTGTNVDLTGGVIPDDFRLDVLQEAAKDLVGNTNDIRWCVSDLFHSTPFVTAACGSNTTTLEAGIDSTDPPEGGGTPLAESFHELTEYFRGISGHSSPVQYRCQQNFAIVVTDGYPTSDIGNTGDITNETKIQHGLTGPESLPNWDGLAPATTVADFNANTIPPYSDGFGTAFNGQGQEGSTLYLDDLAKFGFDVDLFRTGTDDAGQPFGDATDDPSVLTNFSLQNIRTYTIGFGIDNQMLKDAAEYGGGLSFSADNADQLEGALDTILLDVAGIIGSSAASTATTSFLSSGNQVFQVKYDTNHWTGELISNSIDADPESPTFGEVSGVLWTTDTNFTTTSMLPPPRNVLTVNDASGDPVEMVWGNISTAQQGMLGFDSSHLDYILGDQTNEAQFGGTLRSRTKLLPDVVHGAPEYVADQDFGYEDDSYRQFYESALIQDRDPIVWVAGNGGFMHGFDAPADSSGGTEAFAFVPRSVYEHLNDLTDPTYSHHYFVDATPIIIDSQIEIAGDLEWRSVLVGTMGAGAEGIFALDVTDPGLFSDPDGNAEELFLWENDNQFPQVGGGYAITNLAPSGGIASQSSTASSGAASRAIDGNIDGNYSGNSVTQTNAENHAWWELVLPSHSYIDTIDIYNRTDCCSDRLKDFSVFVSAVPFTSQNLTATQSQDGVTEIFVSGEAGSPTELKIGQVAKYVRVQLNDNDVLSIAELKVYGTVPEFPHMGHLLDRSSVIRVKLDDVNDPVGWYVVTGNGVHSAAGYAVFYRMDLTTGEKINEIILDDGGDNGIISNTAIDLDGDDSVDIIYLTDIKGNIWRLDWSFANGEFFSPYTDGAGDPVPFFQATVTLPGNPGNGDPQPIMTPIEVTRFPGDTGALMLNVGTGKYYDIEDSNVLVNEPERTFYGIVDRGPLDGVPTPPHTTLDKSSLVEQTITEATVSGNAVRATSNNDVNYATHNGWFIDLPTDGERVINEAFAFKDRILFTTLIPSPVPVVDPCIPQVTGWLMEVTTLTGASPDQVTFDINNDDVFDDNDVVPLGGGVSAFAAGIQPSTGAPLPPSIIRVEPGGGQEGELKGILSDTSGQLQEFTHEAPIGRTSWIRLN